MTERGGVLREAVAGETPIRKPLKVNGKPDARLTYIIRDQEDQIVALVLREEHAREIIQAVNMHDALMAVFMAWEYLTNPDGELHGPIEDGPELNELDMARRKVHDRIKEIKAGK